MSPDAVPADGTSAALAKIIVRSDSGVPCPGLGVVVEASHEGVITSQPTVTDAQGGCVFDLRSARPGTYTLTAKVIRAETTLTLPVTGLVTFIDPTSGPGIPNSGASSLAAEPNIVAADGVTTARLTVSVRDSLGHALIGIPVSFTSTGTQNDFANPDGVTDAQGSVATTLASTVPEAKHITAHAAGAVASVDVLFADNAPSLAFSSLSAAPTTVVADGQATSALVLTIRDAVGNPLPGQAVELVASGAANALTPSAGVTDADGHFAATLASTKAETKQVSAAVAVGNDLRASVVFIPGPPDPNGPALTVVGAPSAVANGTSGVTLRVLVRDAQGNPIANLPVAISGDDPNAVFSPATPT
ncbi:MAG TPA: Ig-like domain-containing protein, partial [Myxococcota bacterium]|nr:Ig-like domain-containing protein [Myxococcota bacterium]